MESRVVMILFIDETRIRRRAVIVIRAEKKGNVAERYTKPGVDGEYIYRDESSIVHPDHFTMPSKQDRQNVHSDQEISTNLGWKRGRTSHCLLAEPVRIQDYYSREVARVETRRTECRCERLWRERNVSLIARNHH